LRLEKGGSIDYDVVFMEMQRDKKNRGKVAKRKALKTDGRNNSVEVATRGVLEELAIIDDNDV